MRLRFGFVFFMMLSFTLSLPRPAPAKVKVYLDETRTEYIMADELDCRVYEGESGLTIGFKAGNYFFSVGPEIPLGGKERIAWDKSVHGILARYKELCARFNAGAVTMKGYRERLDRIDEVAARMLEFQQELLEKVKSEADESFRELDKETKEVPSGEISRRLEEIGSRLKRLD